MSADPSDSPDIFAAHAVSKIVVIYVAFAASWIWLSDQAVILIATDPHQIALISTIKGWLFVAITSLLLSLTIRRYLNRLIDANKQLQISQERWKFALEGAGDGVWDWNFETGAAQFSIKWKEMLGFGDNEIERLYSRNSGMRKSTH